MKELYSTIDHTLLKPYGSWEEIKALVTQAIERKAASVCIPPCYVKRVKAEFPTELTICTVIGFPLGYQDTKVKVYEAKKALEDGASEIDMVINLTDVKNGYWNHIQEEIRQIREVVGDHCLKVIVETCYLTEEEKIRMCHIVTEEQADFIKTSTGYGSLGATVEDIELFQQHIGPKVKIKAAGGIRTKEEALRFLEKGCSRIGSSSVLLEKGD